MKIEDRVMNPSITKTEISSLLIIYFYKLFYSFQLLGVVYMSHYLPTW